MMNTRKTRDNRPSRR